MPFSARGRLISDYAGLSAEEELGEGGNYCYQKKKRQKKDKQVFHSRWVWAA